MAPVASPVSVVYGAATSVNGAQPVSVACTPVSGATFPIGSTTVTCIATDNLQRTDSCTFTVTVAAPPKISATSYVAFGDSMTAGEVVSEGSGHFRTLRVDPDKAYPTLLHRDLAAVYATQAQSITVDNQGLPDETAVNGASRLSAVLARGNYQVLTLMEGANDLANRDSVTAQRALVAIQSMVHDAKNRGVRVFLATLPPENAGACCPQRGLAAPLVPPFNDGLRGIANSEGVPLVDVYQAFNGDNTTLIDFDGLHPTPAGYQVIADTFFKLIKQELQVMAGSPASMMRSPFGQAPVFVRPRRR